MPQILHVSLAPTQRPAATADTAARALLNLAGASVILGAATEALAAPVTPTPHTMFGPRGGVLCDDDSLWIADTGHHRLLGWKQCPDADNTLADLVIGQPDFFHEGRNAKGEVTAQSLNVPTGVAQCGAGLAVADAWNHRVLLWHKRPASSHTPADVVLGQSDFSSAEGNRGNDAPTAETLFWPYGVHWDEARLWVADTGNRRVLMWNGMPTKNGQAADLVLGQPDFTSRNENGGGEPNAMSMRWPHAVAIWRDRLCVTDAGNSRVMIWQRLPQTNNAPCDVVIGQRDFTCVDHNQSAYWPSAASLNMPYGISVANDYLLVADTANSRLLGWHYDDCETGAAASLLAAQSDFQAKGDNRWGLPMRDSVCWPYNLMAAGNTVLVCDSGNNRTLLWRLSDEVAL